MTTKSNKQASGVKVSRRGKPTIPKTGVTKNKSRRYDCGGKIKRK